jgi:hypothetical protein
MIRLPRTSRSVFSFLAVLALPLCGRAAEIDVPSTAYPTIQAGIDAASAGDTVLVAPGTYSGSGDWDLDFRGKAITVQSAGGAAVTAIDLQTFGNPVAHRAFVFHTNETAAATVRGFTISGASLTVPGAIAILSPSGPTSPTIDQCVFSANNAAQGAAIYAENGSPAISRCIFFSNKASSASAALNYGGAIAIASSDQTPQTARIVNDVFYGNAASTDGAAIALAGIDAGGHPTPANPTALIDNCTFTNNIAGGLGATVTITALPGAIGARGGKAVISNSILYGDRYQTTISQMASEVSTLNPPGAGSLAQYSDVQGGYAGTGNIDAVPQFHGPGANLTLLAASPAIDAGHAVSSSPSIDIVSTARDARPDMGAYEYAVQVAAGAISASLTAAYSGQVATFADTTGGQTPLGAFSAVIQWGDGQSSAGAITQAGSRFAVSGSHAFARGGVLPLTVTVSESASAHPVSGTGQGTVTVLGSPVDHLSVSAPAAATAGTPFTVVVTAYDQYGLAATGYAGTVRLAGTAARESLPPFLTLAGGTGSATASLNSAGSQTISAVDIRTAALAAASPLILVAAGPTAGYQIRVREPAIAGVPFTFNVLALDGFGNIAPVPMSGLQFSSSDPQALLSAGGALAPGIVTVGATLLATGDQTVTVTDAAARLTATAHVTVAAPGPAVRLRLDSPTSATAGTPIAVSITALDAAGHTARGYTGTVHVTSADPNAALPASVTLTNGAGSFPVTFKTVGRWTITAADTVNAGITGVTSMVAVTPGAAAQLSVTSPPAVAANRYLSVTVKALDAYGNIATGYAGTMHLTSTDPSATLPADGSLFSGQRTFQVICKTVGSRTVTATDTANTALTATTGTVTITAH